MPAATHSNRRFQPETAFDTLPQTATVAMPSVKTPKEYQRIVEPLETDKIKPLLKALVCVWAGHEKGRLRGGACLE